MAFLGRAALFALLLLAGAAASARAAESVQLVEQKIKAGLIYNFLKYTTWPALAQRAPMVVCLLGGDPFDGHLNPLSGRTVNQHTIEIRTLRGAAEARACLMLIVHQDEGASWPAIRESLTGEDVLTVSDLEGFAQTGGMIEFARADQRIGVKVNLDAVGATHLLVQDRLLKLASIVRPSAEP